MDSILRAWCRVQPKSAPEARELDQSGWKTLLEQSRREGVAGLVFRAAALDPEAAPMPDEVRTALRNAALTQSVLHARQESVLAEVLAALKARDVDPVLLRGCGLVATVYDGDGSLRGQVDHDLLVREEDEPSARQALIESGFRSTPSGGPFLRGASIVDLHVDPYGRSRIPSRAMILRADTAALIERAVRVGVAGTVVSVPSPEDRLLLLCTHAVKHSFDRLIRLVDVAECWRAGDFDPERLLRRSLDEGSSDFLYYALAVTRRRLGAEIPVGFLRRLRPDRRLVVDRAVARYLAGNPVHHLAEWLLLYQVEGLLGKARAVRDLFWPAPEIDRVRIHGPWHAAWTLPARMIRRAGRAVANASLLLPREPGGR